MKQNIFQIKSSLFTLLFLVIVTGCGGGSSSGNHNDYDNTTSNQNIQPDDIDQKVVDKFGHDTSLPVQMSDDAKKMVGNWYGKKEYMQIRLQLRADGRYKYFESLGIGKFHNISRVLMYEGKWRLANGNAQLILDLNDTEVPLVLSNRFPKLVSSGGITLNGGSEIDKTYTMHIDTTKDTIVSATHRNKVKKVFAKNLRGVLPGYFTMVAAKANSELFWSAAGIKPPGYSYGHKIYKPFLESDKKVWEYVKKRNEEDPKNYIVVISDESWTVFMGHRKSYESTVMDPVKVYKWLFYWKTEMMQLGQLKNGVLHIFAGDPPPYFMGNIRTDHDNNASNVPAKIKESRFPDALELNPPQTFAGLFQVMDYIRMKYAPNVRLGYTLKEWGSQGLADEEPGGGWENDPALQKMADEINSFGVSWDYLAFNLNPTGTGGKRSDSVYKTRVKYFGTVAKKLLKRDGKTPAHAKAWIWKSSLWSNHPSFYFRNIDFLVNDANIAGMTLGHGNDWSGHRLDDFKEPAKNWPLKSWIEEYYHSQKISLSKSRSF